ncbi:hypothetical protein N2384_01640 [Bacillus paralicheniformis]|uniref:hypothetical protein n=1 Tax=Bacillus paralicheniformis TaxID=1648923 RepID=UPI0021A796A6|nr:hypothetical protein [Bacillus paralicheniformis]UWS61959.1 hypothetical protein N2384_01640 [Bacillus paralicheniformis]
MTFEPENIFATNHMESDPFEDFGDFELPTLSLDEVPDTEERPTYVPIPAGTRVDFEVYDAEFGMSSQKGTPFWKLTLQLVHEGDMNRFGPKKRIFKDVYITEKTMQPFVKPLLKATGITYEGRMTKKFAVKDFPEAVVGKKISYKIIGYKWKNGEGSYEQSFGRKSDRSPVPTQEQLMEWGSFLNEEVENPLPVKDEDGSGIGEFDASNFL